MDLQTDRAGATQVASGIQSTIIGGVDNTAGGTQSVAFGAQNNTGTGIRSSILGGISNDITSTGANNTMVGGLQNDITGTQSNGVVIGGNNHDVSGSNAGAFAGQRNIVSGTGAVALGGSDSQATQVDSLVAGDNGRAIHAGARVFANAADTDFPSIQVNEFAIQGAALRLVDTYQGAGNVLTSDANGSGNWAHPAKPVYTVATLPATPAQGDVAMVTDALTPAFLSAVASGGAVVTPVFYNGTAWIVG